MKTLVTGAAGFIGSHVCRRLCNEGYDVVGIDNLNDYYDINLKHDRLKLINNNNFKFYRMNIEHLDQLTTLFEKEKFDYVIHLAAQAGVRHSAEAPMDYGQSNLIGFLSILEACRSFNIKHLVYASSSSVYGLNEKVPFSTVDNVDHPASLYGATKKSNELMAHSYSNMYDLPTTGLRFFSVYGPWSRPDMALIKFADLIVKRQPIDVFNHGDLYRDFTYIDDIVEAIIRVQSHIPKKSQTWNKTNSSIDKSSAPYQLFNVGHGYPVKLTELIDRLEIELEIPVQKRFLPMQRGEVYTTYSDTKDLFEAVGFTPIVSIKKGIENFVSWYKEYYIENISLWQDENSMNTC